MSALFQVLPENFFHPLASPGKIVYWECMERLFAITSQQLSFGVERDVLVDELTYYFDAQLSAEIEEDADTGGMSSRDKANFILRRLEGYGWIYTDVDYSYVQRVNFRDYAVTMMKSLQNISGGQRAEYQGYIYTIYNLTRAKESPGVGLLQIVENTDALITGLKTLNANIKKYIDELTKHQTVQEIMDALLNDYYTNVVDKAYHRLVTSDNVSKFRPEILDRLESNARSGQFLERAAKEIAEIKELPEENARELVMTYLHQVISAFREMDVILEEINQKNTKYQGAAIARAKFLLTSNADVRGQLKTIVTALAGKMQEENLDPAGFYELEETDRLIRIFSWNFLDMNSLYAPVEGRKEFAPKELETVEIDETQRRAKHEAMEKKLANVLSPAKIGAYVEKCLNGRESMMASEILQYRKVGEEQVSGEEQESGEMLPSLTEQQGMEGDSGVDARSRESAYSDLERFIRLIYIRLYGQRKRMSYRVIPQNEIEVKGYRFRNFTIVKR